MDVVFSVFVVLSNIKRLKSSVFSRFGFCRMIVSVTVFVEIGLFFLNSVYVVFLITVSGSGASKLTLFV